MADPVAEKSAFLKMYMTNHPDTLVAYAKYFGNVKEPMVKAEMSEISTKSMTLGCTMKSGAKQDVVVVFDPPLAGYEEVKPRLLEMKAIAQEGLGMIKTPQISSFSIPYTEVIRNTAVLGALLYVGLSPKNDPSPIWQPAQQIYSQAGILFDILTVAFFIFRTGEISYVAWLSSKHTSFPINVIYILSTAVFGLPMCKELRRKIQAARIESVMKVE